MVFVHRYRHFLSMELLCYIIIGVFASIQNLLAADPAQVACKIMKPTSAVAKEAEYFTNTWAVRVVGGVSKAKSLAKRLGYDFHKKITPGLPDIYLFRNRKYPAKTKYAGEAVTKQLSSNKKITWVEQQLAEMGEARKYVPRTIDKEPSLSWSDTTLAYACPNPNVSRKQALNLNDEYWPKQYYIKDCRRDYDERPGDLNLAPVWVKHHLFGKNIKVIVVDDGLETRHLDLVDNYDRTLGLDLQDGDESPDPVHYWWHKFSHGTRCAGVIGMTGNNTICGVGIAPSVTLGAVRLLGPNELTDYKIGTAFLFRHAAVHIMSNSWGPNDDGKSMPYAGPLTRTALKIGISKGREGKGLIYVFAGGNGKRQGDHCGCDALVSTIYSIAVASCDHRGKITTFSERCASIMITTYSGDRGNLYNVIATDIGGNKCTTEHIGTSASAPMVAGAVALALEANTGLSWRDIQHLLAWTGQVAPLQHNPPGTWMKNGAGFYVSHDFGFGMLNINDLIEKAKNFQSVGPMNTCISRADLNEDGEVFRNRIKVEITTRGCEGSPSEVVYLEHVQLTVSLGFPRRGDLQIILTSPSGKNRAADTIFLLQTYQGVITLKPYGTKARLLDMRPSDSYPFGIRFWAFDSIMTWGESPKGKWTAVIIGKKQKSNYKRFGSSLRKFWSTMKNTRDGTVCYPGGDDIPDDSLHIGELNELTLTFHGTSAKHVPEHYKKGPRSYHDFTLPL